jgi:hypothetical protein
MRIKCPTLACGRLMSEPEPYRLPGSHAIAGYRSTCVCGCIVDEPAGPSSHNAGRDA